MSWRTHEVTVDRNPEGRFGFSFDDLHNSTYEISKVSDALQGTLKQDDILVSINGKRTELEVYSRSEEARSLPSWKLIIERQEMFPSYSHDASAAPEFFLTSDDDSHSVGSNATDSLAFSILDSTDCGSMAPDSNAVANRGPHLVELAIDKPISIIWSDEMNIRYLRASHIVGLKFKKKETKNPPKKEWILVQRIDHVGITKDVVCRGDWILKLNGIVVPFFCPEGTTIWVRNHLRQLNDSPVIITVRRPYATVNIESRERLNSVLSLAPTVAPSLPSPLSNNAEGRSQLGIGTGSTDSLHLNDYSSGRALTLNPDLIREGKKHLDRCRGSVQLRTIDRLGRCRLLFHQISLRSDEQLTEDLQQKIFGGAAHQSAKQHGHFFKEYHVHALLSEDCATFTQPNADDCFSSTNKFCSFEMHETVERVFEKTAKVRDAVLTLPDHISSGPISVSVIKQYSAAQDDLPVNKMHLEILSLTGPSVKELKTWCSPILYCKHSINVLVVDVEAFFDGSPDLERLLSKALCEINAYSRDFSQVWEHAADDPKVMYGKSLLVVTNTLGCHPLHLRDAVHHKLKAHLSRLIKSEDNLPFVCYSDVAHISRLLVQELKFLSLEVMQMVALRDYQYPHVGVMLSQQLNQETMDVIDLGDLKRRLRDLLEIGDDKELSENLVEGTLHLLQNTGMAYIPKLSYSSAIGKGCENVAFSLLIHPHRLVGMIEQLGAQLSSPGPETFHWKRLLNHNHAEKFIGIMKEMRIILPAHKDSTGDNGMVQIPLARRHFISRCAPDTSPDLVLCYKDNLSTLLLTSLLNELDSQAVSSNIDYHSSSAQFHVYDCDVCIFRATETPWGSLTQQPASVTDQALCFYIARFGAKASEKEFTAALIEFLNDFHIKLSTKDRPTFGPPCPLAVTTQCRKPPPHVIDILDPAKTVLSCSGISLETCTSVTDYVSRGASDMVTKRRKRASILARPAADLPKKLLDQLQDYSTLDRNWVGLAQSHNFTQGEIDNLTAGGSPALDMMKVLSDHRGYTIEKLYGHLVEMERIDITSQINEWIDEECVK